MSYFKEVEFELSEDPGENPKPKNQFELDKEKLNEAYNQVVEEINRIRRGESEYTTYAIDPGDFGFPVMNRLKMLKDDPSKKNYVGFLEIAKQDLGIKAASYFMTLILKAKKDNTNE